MSILIVDYGMANLRSVQKAFEKVGAAAEITSDPHKVKAASKVVLPGVGAFQDAIAKLRETGLADAVTDHIRTGKPLFGICLGLQLLFERGLEDGVHTGLGILKGDVVPFAEDLGVKVPHMGWNTLKIARPGCPLFKGLPDEAAFYFVHGYYAVPSDPATTIASSDYPHPFTAAVWQENVFATQFHPEKSQAMGQVLLRNFASL
jgi:glutamine amidotransferase